MATTSPVSTSMMTKAPRLTFERSTSSQICWKSRSSVVTRVRPGTGCWVISSLILRPWPSKSMFIWPARAFEFFVVGGFQSVAADHFRIEWILGVERAGGHRAHLADRSEDVAGGASLRVGAQVGRVEDGAGEEPGFLFGGGRFLEHAFVEQREPASVFVVFEDVLVLHVPRFAEHLDGHGDPLLGIGEGVGWLERRPFGKLDAGVIARGCFGRAGGRCGRRSGRAGRAG